ncbi:MAG TPA: nitrile hydratase subunit beta [Solirubrobacteraceae bacterium]|nr:nitrile hydratase subunit beta [Solirubrobacteraceae bacterium]
MDGVHDLGGMQDFGPVLVEPAEPVFHASWEARVFGIGGIVTLQGLANTNTVRHAIERMDPAHYLGSPYFEHWLTAFATLLVERGVLTREELEAHAGGSFPLSRPPQALSWAAASAGDARSRFAVGDRVRVWEAHQRGHTRCPRYVRGRQGVVDRCDGAFTLPDADVHGDDPPIEPTYSVRFDATELWGEEAEPGATVSVDLWESYLKLA